MLKIVVPLGGEAKRFQERGSIFPKPLVEIGGRSMIEVVAGNLEPSEPHQFVYVARAEDLGRFALREVLALVSPGCSVVSMRRPTAGALCSVLLAVDHFEPEEELLLCNGDQFVDVAMDDFLDYARREGNDGCILTFPSTHPKWSFVKAENGLVVQVAEKRPISQLATAGIYWFRRCGDFLKGAERLLLKNASLDGQYYVCPVYNELILMGKQITHMHIAREQMHSLGTPEDVDAFRAHRGQHSLEVVAC